MTPSGASAIGLDLAGKPAPRLRAEGLVTDAELVVSELATNAVDAQSLLDADGSRDEAENVAAMQVRLLLFEASIVIEVWDGDPAAPRPQDGPEEALTRDAERAGRRANPGRRGRGTAGQRRENQRSSRSWSSGRSWT